MSAGYGLPSAQKLQVPGSHTKVAKAPSRSDRAYLFVESRIESCIRRFERPPAGTAAKPAAGEADDDLLGYKRRVADLRGSFEARNPGGRERVCEEGPGLSETIDNLDDRRLSSLRRVFKYEYGGWLELLIARCTDDQEVAAAHARRGLDRLERALELIEDLRASHASGADSNDKEAYEYVVQEGNDHHRSRYLLALAKAFLGQRIGLFSREDVLDCLQPIPESYRRKYPPQDDPVLRWAFSAFAKADGVAK